MSPAVLLMLTSLGPVPDTPVLVRAERPVRVRVSHPLSGGGAADGMSQLVDLIQTNVAPATWQINGGNGAIIPFGPGAAAAPGGGNANAGASSLINLIQTNVSPASWDINGGKGTILPFCQ